MNPADLLNVLQVVLGIGLVIFVHEAGHFMAARWCGARVEVFSLGFGPRLFGWQRGDTLFQVAAVPLGGYVKVAGEYSDGLSGSPEPGTLATLSVPQRFLYFSGGVIMNVIFALVVLPLVMLAGLPALEPIVGAPTPGMPAWRAGVPAGTRILEVNGAEIVDFEHLVTAVALNGSNRAELKLQRPGEGATTVELTPQFDENLGFYRLGLPAGFDVNHRLVVDPDGPAAAAGVGPEDQLLAVVGQPDVLRPEDQLRRAFASRAPVTLKVQGPKGGPREVTVEPLDTALDIKRIGIGALSSRVKAARTTGPAHNMIASLGLLPGDRITHVAGSRVWDVQSIRDALLTLAKGSALELQVQRNGEAAALTTFADVEPVLVLEDLALEVVDETSRVVVSPASPAAMAGVLAGDQVISVNGQGTDTWPTMLETIQREVAAERDLKLEVWRDAEEGGAMTELTIDLAAAPVIVPDYGVRLAAARTILKADSLPSAISAGVGATKRFLVDVWLQLKKMLFSSEISTRNLGGIISISVISFDTASQGLPKLFFFLAILSINLAILNLLPIPILDGGHLLFLLIEGIKGSPVSERTFGYSQVVGMVMIMSLMVYVTYQDIVRWFIEPR
ncbi:MAG: site-2 protease family protein [Planctomycetota bacterium]|nr:site-2 protease family protein [Planctomycetota bacterium]